MNSINAIKANKVAHELFDLLENCGKQTAFIKIHLQDTETLAWLFISVNVINRPGKKWLADKIKLIFNNRT